MRLLYPTPGPGGLIIDGSLECLTTSDVEMERFLSRYFGKIREYFPENHLRLCARKEPGAIHPTFGITIFEGETDEPVMKRYWALREDALSDLPANLQDNFRLLLYGQPSFRDAHTYGRYSDVAPCRVPSFNVGKQPRIEGFFPIEPRRKQVCRIEHCLAHYQVLRELCEKLIFTNKLSTLTASLVRESHKAMLPKLDSWTYQLQTGELPHGVTPGYRRMVAYLRGGQPKTIFDA